MRDNDTTHLEALKQELNHDQPTWLELKMNTGEYLLLGGRTFTSSGTHNDGRGLAQESKHLEFQFAQRGHGTSDGDTLQCPQQWPRSESRHTTATALEQLTSTITINRPVKSASNRKCGLFSFHIPLLCPLTSTKHKLWILKAAEMSKIATGWKALSIWMNETDSLRAQKQGQTDVQLGTG
jgi:hypothetical protein